MRITVGDRYKSFSDNNTRVIVRDVDMVRQEVCFGIVGDSGSADGWFWLSFEDFADFFEEA